MRAEINKFFVFLLGLGVIQSAVCSEKDNLSEAKNKISNIYEQISLLSERQLDVLERIGEVPDATIFEIREAASQIKKDELELFLLLANKTGWRAINQWEANEQAILDLKEVLSDPLNDTWKKAYSAARARAAETDVIISYDDKNEDIGSTEKEKIAELLILNTEIKNWDTIQVVAGEDLKERVSQYYNIDPEEYERLNGILVNAIIEANKLRSSTVGDGTLRIPPYPPQSEGCLSWNPLVWAKCFINFGRVTRRFDPNDPRANSLQSKGVDVTEFVLSGETAIKKKTGQEIPTEALIFTKGDQKDRLANVRFLSGSSIPVSFDSIGSPFEKKAKIIINNFGIDSLKRKAKRLNLWIIDWDFDDGHGAKVRSVVDNTLNNLGLDLSEHIRHIDLSPSDKNIANIEILIDDYAKDLIENASKANKRKINDLRQEAIDWVKRNKDSEATEVHEFILFAAISRPLRAVRDEGHIFAVINFSQEYKSNAFKLYLERELSKHTDGDQFIMFNAAGKGRTWQALTPFTVPQSLAAYISDMYNVAGLDCDFESGTASTSFDRSISYAPPVHIVAQGCGFHFGEIVKAEYGSSFASPLVAASFWIRKLLYEDNRIESKTIINATTPPMNNKITKRSDFGGFFDPYAALVDEQSFVISQNSIRPVKDCSGTINFQNKGNYVYPTQNRVVKQVEIAPIICRGGRPDCLWIRVKKTNSSWNSFTVLDNANGAFEAYFESPEYDENYTFNSFNFMEGVFYAKCIIE